MNSANGDQISKLQNFSTKITCIKFSSDDKLLAVGEAGYKIKLWNVEKKEVKKQKYVIKIKKIEIVTHR